MEAIGYIYIHRSPSGKGYVGQTTSNPPDLRWRSKDAYSANVYFSAAISKHGWENFEHEILAEVVADTKELLVEKLNELEPIYIQQYNTLIPNGYNIQPGGYNAPCAEETKQKIREKLKGRQRSAESIERQKVAQIGRKVSQETREKLRAIHTGRVMSPEACEKMRKAAIGNTRRKGTKTSEQGLANIRAAAARRGPAGPMLEETKQKISAGNSGKVRSAEARLKMSESHKGLHMSVSQKQHLSQVLTGKPKPPRTPEHVAKIWETRRLNGTDIASNKGKVCITDGISNRYIMANDILPEGWHYGSSQPNRIKKFDKTWLNDGQYAYFIANDEVDKYLTLGYKKGKNGFKKKPN